MKTAFRILTQYHKPQEGRAKEVINPVIMLHPVHVFERLFPHEMNGISVSRIEYSDT